MLNRTKCVTVFLGLFFISSSLFGAVTEWAFIKGRGSVQVADNQRPSVTSWDVEVYVEVDSVNDASSATISGGGLSGDVALVLDGTEWIYEKEYDSEAAMDADFPNETTYTLTLSGGTLGTLTQSVTLGAKDYPDQPYLVGSGFSDLEEFDPAQAFDFVFGAPGNAANKTLVEVEEDGDDSPFDSFVDASQQTITMPADSLQAGAIYEVFVDHLNRSVQSGTGGFGIDGDVWQSAYGNLTVDTRSAGSIIGSWAFGDSTGDGSGVVVLMKDGNYFHIEDVSLGDGDPDGFERGTYTWNEGTGAFQASPIEDLNGETGLSHPAGSTTVSVSGNTLTYTDNEGSSDLTRVTDPGNRLVGAWQFNEAGDFDSGVIVFLPNGVFFAAQTNVPQANPNGIEKGTYQWDSESGSLTTDIEIDTNGTSGLSHPLFGFNTEINDDELIIWDGDNEWRLYLVDPSTPGIAIPSVTHWRIVKGRDHVQNMDNTAPPVALWSVYAVVRTKLNLDASEMNISGGGIDGSHSFTQIGREWTFEKDFDSEEALNAEFPAGGSFTIALSGGNLGAVSQSFTLMADEYPNTPYLTGSKFSAAKSLDSFSDFGLTWSDPGSRTENSGLTSLEVYRYYDDEEVLRVVSNGAVTQGTIQAGTVFPGHAFYGYLEYTHASTLDGTGGFGIDGTDSRNAAVDFTLAAPNSPLAGAWTFGDASTEASGVIVFLNNGSYLHIEDVAAADPDPDGFERGKYFWDRDSGEFEVETISDTNGSVGLSDSGDDLTVTVSGNTLTFTDGQEINNLSRVVRSGDDVVGAWQWGDGQAVFGGVYVLLESGYYFHMQYNEPEGAPLEGGIERGSYTYDSELLEMTTTTLVDTNGELGFSHVDGFWTVHVFEDYFAVGDNRGGETGYDASMADVPNRMRFLDSGFDAALRDATGKANGPLLRLDMQRISRLDASNRGISEIEGLQEAYNIRQLDLSHNSIVDIWQVGDLVELRELDLSHNQITSISDLSNLKNLVSLDISSNDLSDTNSSQEDSGIISLFSDPKPFASTGVLAPLDGIDTLNTLRFANNAISDLSTLSTLPDLKEVDLSGNDISDLTVLQDLPKLEKVAVFGNPVDLSEGSSQRTLLDSIVSSTGASVQLEALDPNANYLELEWDEASQRYRLIWSANGTLQKSDDLKIWMNLDDAQSPYPIDFVSGELLFWKLDL